MSVARGDKYTVRCRDEKKMPRAKRTSHADTIALVTGIPKLDGTRVALCSKGNQTTCAGRRRKRDVRDKSVMARNGTSHSVCGHRTSRTSDRDDHHISLTDERGGGDDIRREWEPDWLREGHRARGKTHAWAQASPGSLYTCLHGPCTGTGGGRDIRKIYSRECPSDRAEARSEFFHAAEAEHSHPARNKLFQHLSVNMRIPFTQSQKFRELLRV